MGGLSGVESYWDTSVCKIVFNICVDTLYKKMHWVRSFFAKCSNQKINFDFL